MVLIIIVGKSSSSCGEMDSDFHHFLVLLLGTGPHVGKRLFAFDCLTQELARRQLLRFRMVVLDFLSFQLMQRTHRSLSYMKNMLILYFFLEFFRQCIQPAHFLRSKELGLGVMLRRDSLDPSLKVDLPFIYSQSGWFAAFLKLLHRLLLKRIELDLVLTLLQFGEGLIERILFFHHAQLTDLLHHIRSLLQKMIEDMRVMWGQVLAFLQLLHLIMDASEQIDEFALIAVLPDVKPIESFG